MQQALEGIRVLRQAAFALSIFITLGNPAAVAAATRNAPVQNAAIVSEPIILAQADTKAEPTGKSSAASKPAASSKPRTGQTVKKPVGNTSKTAKQSSSTRTKKSASAPAPRNTGTTAGAVAAGAVVAGATAAAAPALFAQGGVLPGGETESSQAMESRVGAYRCELNRLVKVLSMSSDQKSVVLSWLGRDHTLTATETASGALRYENEQAGLTWLVIVGKAMLLDSNKGEQLANECRL